MPKEPTQVQIARINARQAIIVAIVSAATGVAATLFSSGLLAKRASDKQVWLTVLNVELEEYPEAAGVRVIAEVNGRGISYPTRAIWAQPTPGMPGESFAIEEGDQYRVRMEVIAASGTDRLVLRYVSQEIDTYYSEQLPIETTYELYQLGTEGMRSGTVSGRVKYRLSH